jgi:hypothetical protein
VSSFINPYVECFFHVLSPSTGIGYGDPLTTSLKIERDIECQRGGLCS